MKRMLLLCVCICLFAGPRSTTADDRSVQIKELQEMRSERRIALVIGNADYVNSPLKNPVHDARLIAQTLRSLGFEVILCENATQKQMKKAIDDFGLKIRGKGAGLFYYAGHGMQVNGRNFLIPVDASISSENEVEFESVDSGRVLAKMENAGSRVNIVILDACRDNPYSRSFRSVQKGLAYSDAPKGSFIAYATAPGSVAGDGAGSNSIFTEEFVKAVKSEGLEIDRVFKRVRSAVMRRTDEKQVPWTSSSLVGDFFFTLPAGDIMNSSLVADQPSVPADSRGKSAPKAAPKTSQKAQPDRPGPLAIARETPAGRGDRLPVYTERETGMDMVLVKGACFDMGDASGTGHENERPVHKVCVNDFFISRTEITQSQWRGIRGNNPSSFGQCGDSCPAENVSWNDVQEYIRILNQKSGKQFRLPTEAEWEYAARGGSDTVYPGSDQESLLNEYAWYAENSEGQTRPVGQKYPNGFGMYDMSGNVWEWCSDWYDQSYYQVSQRNNPPGPDHGTARVLRGGSWGSLPWRARTTTRNWADPKQRSGSVGFRLVLAQ